MPLYFPNTIVYRELRIQMKKRFQQIDVLKGGAILAVILLHSLTKPQLLQTYAVYHIWQAVPVFLILMGVNLGLGLKYNDTNQELLYSLEYFSKKASRIILPFLFIFLFSFLLGLVWQKLYQVNVIEFSNDTYFGKLPVSGKGNYFITLLFQFILLQPLIGFSFTRHPIYTTIGLVLLEVAFLIISKSFHLFDSQTYLYSAALPRYFSALAYGLWIARFIQQPFKLRPLLLLIVSGILGATYLYTVTYTKVSIPIVYQSWISQNVLSFGYPAALVLLVILLLPAKSNNILLGTIAKLGQASYHIFLTQVVYFGLISNYYNISQNLIICVALGYLFFLAENTLRNRKHGLEKAKL